MYKIKHQLFKIRAPDELLFGLLDNISSKSDSGYYVITNDVYKKGIFTNKIAEFSEALKPYYHTSKQIYADRKLTYNSFITMVRQLCKCNNIHFTTEIKYDKSNYNIQYTIHIPIISITDTFDEIVDS